jgi:hypothetical protein
MASVGTWNDTGISAVVPGGAVSGNVQVLQSGVWSNAVPFTVAAPHIVSVNHNPYSPTTITISGSGFGAQSSGSVWIGNMAGIVQTWNDNTIMASPASGALSGVVKVQQNGIWSNAVPFSVSPSDGSNPLTITPTAISLLVGQTHAIEAVNAQGQSVTGLTWASSDTTVVTLSSNDPPILTAVAAGHVTITAGNASADVTVYSGTSLPVGTIQWTNPGDGSGVTKAVPAVPSASGVDVFAFQNSGNVEAISSDGTNLWTANVSNGSAIPDFQGGLVYVTNQTVQELDASTGRPNPPYTYTNSSVLPAPVLLHTDGTIFTVDGNSVVGIDPTSGAAKFSVSLEQGSFDTLPFCEFPEDVSGRSQTDIYSMIIAGDGNAYFVYSYSNDVSDPQLIGNCGASFSHRDVHLRARQISSSGSSAEFDLGDWTEDNSSIIQEAPDGTLMFTTTQAGTLPGLTVESILTNADTGVVVSWSAGFGGYCAYESGPYGWQSTAPFVEGGCLTPSIVNQLSTIGGGGISTAQTSELLQPVLQRADGIFIGNGETDGSMIAFDSSGNIKWSVPNYTPQIATADGGVIAQTNIGGSTITSTFDANGNATGQLGSLPTYSWIGNAYQLGSVDSVAGASISYAISWAALRSGNNSNNGTAVQQQWFPPLPSCPGAQTPCSKEAIASAMTALRTLVAGPCPACGTYVFSILGSNQQQFYQFLTRTPMFFNGTQSNLPINKLCGRASGFGGFAAWFLCDNGSGTVAEYMTAHQSTAVSQTPSNSGQGMMTFFDPAGICSSWSSNPSGILNQALLFHESLHGFYGKLDVNLETAFGINPALSSEQITYYLEDNIFTGGASSCGN